MKHSLHYFKAGPLLIDFPQGRGEPLTNSATNRHYFSTQTVTISSRVGRRFGRRGNVFLPQLSGPLCGRAFEFELLNVVPVCFGRF